jgi:hypothetical protein
MDHVGTFRHALALDERRVKFLPEFAHGGAGPRPGGQGVAAESPDELGINAYESHRQHSGHALRFLKRRMHLPCRDVCRGAGVKPKFVEDQPGDVKEVWFAGSHSDM